ncbi:alpha-2-HS-glycoprotein-like [Trichomycterus rosablanca]|uniref:alpha-2-HS-glycoprotein-like n=1 Tax=Trichomycterus rosablanca TaxID=2290929 RepID=UPI002F34F42C
MRIVMQSSMKMLIIMSILVMVFIWGGTATNLSPVPCDDKSVEKLAKLAVAYINEDRQEGYKFALNRIFNVHVHPQGPAGKVYYLDLDVLETKCHVRSPKPWKRCDIRPFMETQIAGNCNTTVLHTLDGFSYLYSYDCMLVPDSPEKLQRTCPDCPLLLPVDSYRALSSAKMSLSSYTRQSTLPVQLTVASITRASHQVSPVDTVFVEYTVKECSVPPAEETSCVSADPGKGPVGFCVGTVSGADTSQADVKVSCEIFHPQQTGTSGGTDTGKQREENPSTRPNVMPPPVHVADVPASISRYSSPMVMVPDYVQKFLPYTPGPNQSSSESSESSSSSSEEMLESVRIARPPLDFHYAHLREKREAVAATISPTFLNVFPNASSPFRSCPGTSRYTTV